ncbi:dTDP-4-dehydrorhamnose 3,5-epimerase [Daejeonella sp.]|uniref:dTDP-4-dehydrorhamnose 3,5-epimerase n=1 Tax=Daejeonella sp. TaxID=2805397 RepID=UPI002C0E913A|nr:dTDP-4-dehydrorhamnose 3,5-epimerase [Daejeonella sp.]HQT58867.1 dTDP-4-dehydrorhamnose 3,5-epimerase [Daejeonella sp.]
MELIETKIKGCVLFKPAGFSDSEEYSYETFNLKEFNNSTGLDVNFVQDNHSLSLYGVLRGLHFQMGEHAQAKLVRVLRGEVLDVVLDLRPESSTFGKYFSVVLSEENRLQLFIPRGFAHGFVVLSSIAEFFYMCDNYYNKQSECGVLFNDLELNIDWRLSESDIIISEKDRENPPFSTIKKALL